MENTAKSYRDLMIWQKSHQLVLKIYKFTENFPKDEIYVLTSQMRRSAISVPANIAEGFVREGTKDKLRFYKIAESSLSELSYYLLLSKDLGYGKTEDLSFQLEEVAKMINSYTKRIKESKSL